MLPARLLYGFLLIVVFLNVLVSSHDLNSPEDIDGGNNVEIQNSIADTSVALDREKRGWGSVLFTATSILVRITSHGLTLGAALSDGCIYYPSICTNKARIELLDKEIKTKAQQYETEYASSKQMYLLLRETKTNNDYLYHYMNSTLETLIAMQVIENDIILLLETKLPNVARMDLYFDDYLEIVSGDLESRLSDLEDLLAQHRNDVLLGVVVQYIVEATLDRIILSYKAAYQRASSNQKQSADAHLWNNLAGSGHFTITEKSGNLESLNLTKKALNDLMASQGKTTSSFGSSVLQIGRVKTVLFIQGFLLEKFVAPVNRLDSINVFFTAETRATYVHNYKLTWSETIMTGIGIITDVVTTALAAKQWKSVSDQMQKVRNDYEDYYHRLTTEYNKIIKQKHDMQKLMNDNIDVFKGLSLPYKSLVANSSQLNDYTDAVGIAHLPVNTNNVLFTTDFNHLTKNNLKSKQQAVIAFLKATNADVVVIKDKLKSRQIIYNQTLAQSERNEPISSLLSQMKSILKFSTSKTIQDYGHQLTESVMVCNVAMLRSDLTEYDFYPLDDFRPKCDISVSAFTHLKSQSATKRKSKLMQDTIKNKINAGVKSLSTIVNSVHTAYSGVSDASIRSFGHSITDKDILCFMSQQYPSLHTFDFISLDEFRPTCSRVSTTKLHQLEADATKMRSLTQGIQADLSHCHTYKNCACLTAVAQKHKTTVAAVTQVLKHINPKWHPYAHPQYCSTNGCSCKHL